MNSGIIINQNSEGIIKKEVRLVEETVCFTQEQLATLFWKAKPIISENIKTYLPRVN